jgi:hypothetical protein
MRHQKFQHGEEWGANAELVISNLSILSLSLSLSFLFLALQPISLYNKNSELSKEGPYLNTLKAICSKPTTNHTE